MNNPILRVHKLKHSVSGILKWFPRELYASYFVPALFLLCIGTSIVAIDWFYALGGRGFREGVPSPRTYRALSPMTYEDAAVTDRLRDKAGDSVAGVVVRNVGAAERMKLRLIEFGNIDSAAPRPDVLAENFPEELIDAFSSMPDEQKERLLSSAGRVGDVYFTALASGDTGTEWKDQSLLWAEINKLEIPLAERNFVYQLLDEIVEPRYKTDPRLTAFVKDMERNDIPVIERRLDVGDVLVRRGDVITPAAARALLEQGYPADKLPLTQWAMVFLLMLTLPVWMDVVTQEVKGVHRLGDVTWGCVVFVVAVGWVCEAVATRLGVAGGSVLPPVVAAFLCMPRRLAFYVALVGTASGGFLTAGLSAYGILSFLILSFAAATVGFYALMKIDSLKDLRIKVLFMSVFLTVLAETVGVLLGLRPSRSLALGWPLGESWLSMGKFMLFDLSAAFLSVYVLLTIEGSIGAFSVLKARELSHPSTPLLRKLQNEAPGTYHHSLMIGALAEAVAGEMGMDENLMRVGAYYHDIGKMRRPRHFVENQLGGENIHDSLSPTLSAVAIIAHVREGAELANEFGLPKKVRQFISEHHGTTCVSYFYKKALALGENVEREQFCYPGPKPQSRETALLMLMDSLEAAVRSESKSISTVTDLQEVIARVVKIKIDEKQLDDANFTFREIEAIKAASLKALRSMYHTRTVKEIKEKDKDSKEKDNKEKEKKDNNIT